MEINELRARAKALAAPLADRTATQTAVPLEKSDKRVLRKSQFQMSDGSHRALAPIDQVIMRKSKNADVLELQEFNDNSLLLSTLLKCHVTETAYYQERMAKSSPMRKAMDSITATEGLEWVPSNFSAEWIRFVDLQAQVKGLFREIQMPTDPYKIPFQNGRITVVKIAEQTADRSALIADTSVPTSNMVLNAVKLGARAAFSTELEEDSVVPILPMLREEFAGAVAKAIDDAIVNGDSDGAHQDSDVGASATDRRVLWNGLRKHALSSASFNASLSTFSTANLLKLRGLMGKYGVNPDDLAIIVSPATYSRHLMTLAEVATKEKYGEQATILTGEMAKYAGIPVIVSAIMREDLNTTGTYDGTTVNNSIVLIVYRPAWWFGTKRGLELKLFEDIQYDQKYLVGTARHDFKTPWTADAVCVAGVDVDMS